MNTKELQGKWDQIQGEMKAQWGRLTDDDLARIQGSRDKLVGLIEEKYGWAYDTAQNEVDQFLSKYPDAVDYFQVKTRRFMGQMQDRMPSSMPQTLSDNPMMLMGALAALALVLVFAFIVRSNR